MELEPHTDAGDEKCFDLAGNSVLAGPDTAGAAVDDLDDFVVAVVGDEDTAAAE